MIFRIKKKLIYFSEIFHLRIFGHKMSETMREFLGNLSWSFFGGVSAAGIMFLVNILAGRWLGPLGYGNYNYLLSFASSSMFIFLLGNNSSGVRYISDIKYKEEKDSILTASLVLSLAQAALFLLIIILLKNLILTRYSIENNIAYLVFVFGFILSFKDLFDSFLRSLNLIKKQSCIKIADATLVFMSFLFFYYFLREDFSYIFYIYSFLLGGTLFIASSFYLIRKNIAKFEWKHIFLIMHYNKFLILCSVGAFIIGIDKILIGKYIGTEKLGIYSAYYASSQLIISNLLLIFMNIFWPAVIKNKENLSVIIGKIDLIISKFFLIFLVLNFASISFFVYLFGKEYPFNLFLITLFSISSILNIIFYLFIGILNIEKIKHSVAIMVICYSTMVSSIVIFRSIEIYLIFQVTVYIMGVLYIRNKLKQKTL